MAVTPPGWYPDSQRPGGLRYWDGTQWTQHLAAAPHGTPPAARPKRSTAWISALVAVGAAVVILPVLRVAVFRVPSNGVNPPGQVPPAQPDPPFFAAEAVDKLEQLGFTCTSRTAPIGEVGQCVRGKQRGNPPIWDELVNVTDAYDDGLDAFDGYVLPATAAELKGLGLTLVKASDGKVEVSLENPSN